MYGSIRVTFCALSLFAAISGAAPLAVQAGILDGLGAIGAGSASTKATNYPGLLQDLRGLNFGGLGIPYAFGDIGADTSSILAAGNQVDQAVAKINSGDITLVTMTIGDNDYIDEASNIASGALAGAPLAALQTQAATNIATAVNSLQSAGGAVVLGGFANIAHTPGGAGLTPEQFNRLEDALHDGNQLVLDFATTEALPFINFFALHTAIYEAGSAQVGGVDLVLTGFGPDPHNFFEDQFHAGILVRGAITNLYIQAINQGFGTDIPLLTDLEILEVAGLEGEYEQETFNAAFPYASYVVAIPEPSTCVLACIGLLGSAASVRRTRTRR